MTPRWHERDEAARELERRLGVRAERDASLAEHTTMRVGGPADLLVTIRDRFTLRGVVRLARGRSWPLTILGRGSNVVVDDDGVHVRQTLDEAQAGVHAHDEHGAGEHGGLRAGACLDGHGSHAARGKTRLRVEHRVIPPTPDRKSTRLNSSHRT